MVNPCAHLHGPLLSRNYVFMVYCLALLMRHALVRQRNARHLCTTVVRNHTAQRRPIRPIDNVSADRQNARAHIKLITDNKG